MPRRISRELKALSVLALSLALNGCIGFGGIGPKSQMLTANTLATDEAIASAAKDANWPKAQWWHAYGDTLIEATSGNTGIALAMAAAIKGYKMVLIMPDNGSAERKAAMTAYGAQLILVTQEEGMEGARDLAERMAAEGRGVVLDQFANGDNPEAHYTSTGPEIWRQTQGTITHFVSSMGTTGTIMGNSRYLKEQNPAIQIVGLQPMEGAAIPGIRRWPEEYLPKIYNATRVDRIIDMAQREAEDTTRRLAREEGIFCGVSSGGAVAGMLRLSKEVENAVIVAIICDRGDRYLSTGIFDEPN